MYKNIGITILMDDLVRQKFLKIPDLMYTFGF